MGSELICRTIKEMIAGGAEEVALETEVTNVGALRLYEKLGFIRDKRLTRYYLNGSDAYRLKLLLPRPQRLNDEQDAAAAALQQMTVDDSAVRDAEQGQQQQQEQQDQELQQMNNQWQTDQGAQQQQQQQQQQAIGVAVG